MNQNTDAPVPAEPPWAVHVLLTTRPERGFADVIDTISPGSGARFEGVDLPGLAVPVGEEEFLIALTGPLSDQTLLAHAAISPMRSHVEPVAREHRASILIAPRKRSTPRQEQTALAKVAALFAAREDAEAVWLPHQETLTTDVLYRGEVAQRPSLVFFRVHAMQLDADAGTSHAFTRGLVPHLGREVQLSGTTLDPGIAFEQLRTALCEVIDADGALGVDDRLVVAGVPYVARDGRDLIGEHTGRPGSVLDLVQI